MAEETGLIVPMGDFVIRSACRFWHRLVKRYSGQRRVAVNVSARQIMQDNFTEHVCQILCEENFPPEYLEMELTETVLMDSFDIVVARLYELRDMGIRIMLDDFGTGYSSLTYLGRLPIDGLKIDRTFISELGVNPTATAIAHSVVSLAKQIKLSVVAEGVETEEQLLYLKNWNCELIQGYLFSRPLPVQQALDFPDSLIDEKIKLAQIMISLKVGD